MAADLQTIEGDLRLEESAGLRLVDTLSRLPVPTDDVLLRRTFPFGPEEGWVHIDDTGPDTVAFYAIVPRRYGASGMVPGHGLFLNGLWHPQPVRGDAPAVVTWEVDLELPPGTVGVLNGVVGRDRLHWSGRADRLALAVVPGGRAEPLPIPVGQALLVDKGPRRLKRDVHLGELLAEGWPGPGAPDVVLVEAPLRRRLTRAGPGVVFVSDRAFRVTGGLTRFHVAAVLRGLLTAGLPIEDPWERTLAATALTEATRPDQDVRRTLRWLSWIPEIDALLYDGRLPFYDDVFDEVWPGDRVQDDLAELLDPTTPALAIVRRLDARYGEGTSARLAWALVKGADLAAAASRVGVPLDVLTDWRPRPPPQSLSVSVHPVDGRHWSVRVDRQADPAVPPEPITIEVDDRSMVWEAPAGPGAWSMTTEGLPEKVRVDAAGTVNQPRRTDDRWPQRLTMTAAFFPYELNLKGGGLSAAAELMFRRQYSSRWRVDLGLETDPQDVIGATVGVVRYLGPLQDRRNRPFRLWLGGGPSLLDPDFRPVEGSPLALGASAGAAWETRVDPVFARHGHRLSLGVSGGFVPAGDRWGLVSLYGVKLLPLSGRVALATRGQAGLAEGGVAHRLLRLGGSNQVQGLSSSAAVGDQLLSTGVELRWQVLRYASLPLPLLWLSDVQLQAGADGGALWADGQTCGAAGGCAWQALGWSSGASFTGDVLGVRPTSLGAWIAGPAWTSDDAGLVGDGSGLQFYLRLTQAF